MGSQLLRGTGSTSLYPRPPLQRFLVWKKGAEQTPPDSVLRQLERRTLSGGWKRKGEERSTSLGQRGERESQMLAVPWESPAPKKGEVDEGRGGREGPLLSG